MTMKASITKIIMSTLCLLVTACSLPGGKAEYPIDPQDQRRLKRGKLTGEGLTLFGGDEDSSSGGGNAGIGINSYLWRATLDTLSFMPLASADPFGGVIITDWYEDPATPNERFKVNVFILDTKLRADGIQVTVFRQQRIGNDWRDVAANKAVANDLENKILTRARELRINQVHP